MLIMLLVDFHVIPSYMPEKLYIILEVFCEIVHVKKTKACTLYKNQNWLHVVIIQIVMALI